MANIDNYFTVYSPIDVFTPSGYLSKYELPTLYKPETSYNYSDKLSNLQEKKKEYKTRQHWFDKDKLELMQDSNVEVNSSDGISDNMFELLLKHEGSHKTSDGKLKATTEKSFVESFTTGPYGMVYKYIDEKGNLLNKPVAFKEGETVSKEWAEKNAKAYYDKQAKEWKELLKDKNVTQDLLDALVSASGGTVRATKAFKKYILENWDNKEAISKYWRNFATTAAGNGKRLAGLVLRRNFEADWFLGNKKDQEWYLRNRKLFGV